MDIKQALLHPEEMFLTPKEVLDHPEFTKEQKIEILRSWAYEVNECTAAEEEGMVCEDVDEPVHLNEIHAAIHELIGTGDVEHIVPTKQGGI
jgi:hypothetical protein